VDSVSAAATFSEAGVRWFDEIQAVKKTKDVIKNKR
jgi:hypothetical protein